MLYSSLYIVRFIALFLTSYFYVSKSVCFNYIYEMIEQKHIPTALMTFVAWDCASYGIIAGYYLTVSRDWRPVFAFYSILGAISLTL